MFGQLTAEQRVRVLVDWQMTDTGWSVQNRSELNVFAHGAIAAPCPRTPVAPGATTPGIGDPWS